MHLRKTKRRFLQSLLMSAIAVVCFARHLPASPIIISKSFKGGVECSVDPNQIMAVWRMTIGGITTERRIIYVGRTGDNMIELELVEAEKPEKGSSEKLISSRKIPLYLECEGETICRVEEFTIAARLSLNRLFYTILSDWNTVYVEQKDKTKECSNGHKWVQKEYLFCPACGSPLK